MPSISRCLRLVSVLAVPAVLAPAAPAAAQLTAAGGELAISAEIGGPIPGPTIAAADTGEAVVLWTADCGGQGLCERAYDAAGVPLGTVRRLATQTTFFDPTAALAIGPGGVFVVVWTRPTGNLTGEIVARRYTRDGTPLGPETAVHDHPGRLLSRPVVAPLPGGAWVVAWENLRFEGFSGDIPIYSGVAIEARRLSAAGAPQGSVIAVDGPAADLVANPVVAADASGRFVVAWERFDFGPGADDVAARWFDASGTPLGDELTVHQQTLGIQDVPAVAAAPGGGALVAYEHHGTGGQAAGIYARAVTPAGLIGPAEIRVDAPGAGERSQPAVTADGAGRYTVAWRSVAAQDGAIRARHFATGASGAPVPLGGEVAVSNSAGDHAEPAAAADGSGGVFVAWRRRDAAFQRQVRARRFTAPEAPSTCVPGSTVLCLGAGGRFQVEVAWRDQRSGDVGTGTAIPGSDRTGYFWFFNQQNVELVVKALDGRTINEFFWLFYGALSDVEYAISVLDTATGQRRRYDNAAGNICGRGDNRAFPIGAGAPALASGAVEAFNFAPLTAPWTVEDLTALPAAGGTGGTACGGAPNDLCLFGDRFRVSVTWRDQHNNGNTGVGTAVPFGPNSGFFWFFNDANIELVVKILDGRTITGSFWFFYGALSDVEYAIRVVDTMTGEDQEYTNAPGDICGEGDTSAF
jgi:hypothetical protein